MTGRRKEGVSLLIEMRCKDSHIFTIFQTFLQKIRNSSEIIPIKLASINTFIYLCTTFISRSIDNLNLSENNSKNTWRFADFFVSLQRLQIGSLKNSEEQRIIAHSHGWVFFIP